MSVEVRTLMRNGLLLQDAHSGGLLADMTLASGHGYRTERGAAAAADDAGVDSGGKAHDEVAAAAGGVTDPETPAHRHREGQQPQQQPQQQRWVSATRPEAANLLGANL
jgi:hypothetical protein